MGKEQQLRSKKRIREEQRTRTRSGRGFGKRNILARTSGGSEDACSGGSASSGGVMFRGGQVFGELRYNT